MPGQHRGGGGARQAAPRGEPHLRGAAAALAGALLVAAPVPAARADDAELARLRAANARLEARVRELEAENARLRAAGGAGSALEAAAARRVTATVDEARHVTTLDVAPSRLELTGGNRSRHWIALHAERPGDPGRAATATIEIDAAASNGVYRRAERLELSLDGTPLALPVTSRRAEPIVVGAQQQRVGERETVSVSAPADIVARIGAAREVAGRLGPTTFVLSPDQIAAFAAVAGRLAAPDAAAAR